MSSARAIIDAIDPKRILHQRMPQTPQEWAKKTFTQDAPTRFFQKVQRDDLELYGKIWVLLYESSIWYRLVLLRDYRQGPVWNVYELNPFVDERPVLVLKVLDALTKEIRRILAAAAPGDSKFRKRQWLNDQLTAAFEKAKHGLPH